MGENSALRQRRKQAKKKTPMGKWLKKHTRDLKPHGKGAGK